MSKRISTKKLIPVIDLFAGPGGLGEGFSALKVGRQQSPVFQIKLSAEMEPSARKTLLLRAYYRAAIRKGDNGAVQKYYEYCNGKAERPYDESSFSLWKEAEEEALELTLGRTESDAILRKKIQERLKKTKNWVLIGGPPCQAYSLVGRSRNLGKSDYVAKEDRRHYLYREYLKIIQRYRPAVFVMENVKGILSSKVEGQHIFHKILRDLADPNKALRKSKSGKKYQIYSLASDQCFDSEMKPGDLDASRFVIRAENYGVPQARHRVILVGVREDIKVRPEHLHEVENRSTVLHAIHDLPRLRSTLSREPDTSVRWNEVVRSHAKDLAKHARRKGNGALAEEFERIVLSERPLRTAGSLRHPKMIGKRKGKPGRSLVRWWGDRQLEVWLNHEARGHMQSDLRRYLFAAVVSRLAKKSPKGHEEFNLPGLSPDHANWETGKFSDRFRVQIYDHPATTITSHISKDGHYYIHPDPSQCRSLTVREAARLQTFPDNYFFEGNRTQQFVQVGNAVPPFLARQIAQVVAQIFDSGRN